MLKGSILSYTMSCVQNLALTVKEAGITSKNMAGFHEAENKPINFPMEQKKRTLEKYTFLQKPAKDRVFLASPTA